MTALSILDLVRITETTDARGALDNARSLAAHAENWGYRRFWVAEHHNMAGIASAATSVAIAHIAAGTRTIRRSEARRVGNECVRPCRSRWSQLNSKTNNNNPL